MTECNPIYFPVLVQVGNTLLTTNRDEFVKFDLHRHLGGNNYSLKNGSSERLRLNFLIDRRGYVRHFTLLSVHQKWARKLTWLYDFTTATVSLDAGSGYDAQSLLKLVDPLKSPSGFPWAGHLKGVLRKLPPFTVFDADLFREFWDKWGPPLEEAQWNELYPEIKWSPIRKGVRVEWH